MSAADKQAARDAIAAYIDQFGPDVSMVGLRAYVRKRTGISFGGPTLAAFLKAKGYRREGYRPLATCPGQSIFYVPGAAAAGVC